MVFILRLGLLLILTTIPLYSQGATPKPAHDRPKILIINSYHQNYRWTQEVLQGITSHFTQQGLEPEIFYEFMDTRQFPAKLTQNAFKQLLTSKYINSEAPDLIIAVDNHALDFVVSNKNTLFENVPVVFAGINQFKPSMLNQYKDIRGVREDPAILETLALMRKLHPNTSRILVLGDSSSSGQSVISEISKITQFVSYGFELSFLSQWTRAELAQRLQKLNEKDLVLSTAVFNDRDNVYYPAPDMINWLKNQTQRPIYTMWEQFVSMGLTGGVVISGKEAGISAAKLAGVQLNHSNNTIEQNILSSPNVIMLNYNEQKRLKIKTRSLPPNIKIIQKPENFYEKYKTFIWLIIAFIIIQSGFISYLLFNINRRKQLEKQLEKRANFDGLTGLPNRATFEYRLTQSIIHARKNQTPLTIIFLDLDNFKHINDSYGHHFGDSVLTEIANRLRLCTEQLGLIARLSGDEFIIMIDSCQQDIDDIESILSKIEATVEQPILVSSHKFYMQASIGIANFPEDGKNGGELVRHADIAMYQAKIHKQGHSSHCYYSKQFSDTLHRRRDIEINLQHALAKKEFFLHYQPIVDGNGNTISCEALLRWNCEALGNVTPDEFIPIAEETGRILEIGDWVIQTACKDLKKLHLKEIKIPISINISFRQFQDGSILESLKTIIRNEQIAANYLYLEITERLLLENVPYTQATFAALKNMGMKLSIDDFGTGYSSLSYLSQYPFDQLKIDRSFINFLNEDSQQFRVIQGIQMIASQLNMSIVAEGVETEDQLKLLQKIGINKFQGYLFSKSKTINELEKTFAASKH